MSTALIGIFKRLEYLFVVVNPQKDVRLYQAVKQLADELEEKIRALYDERMNNNGKKVEDTADEPVIMPVEAEEAPAIKHKKVNIDIAVDD